MRSIKSLPGDIAKGWVTPLVVTVFLALGFGVGQAPQWIATELHDRLQSKAQRLGLQLDIGHIWVDPFSQVTIDDVVLRAQGNERPLFSAARVQVDFEIYGLSSPKVFVRQVLLDRGALHIHRRASGDINLLNLLMRSPSTKGSGGGGGGLRSYINPHVPKVIATSMAVQIDDDYGPALRTSAGIDLRHWSMDNIHIELHDSSVLEERIDLLCKLRGEVQGIPGQLHVAASMRWPEKRGHVEITLPKDLEIQYANTTLALGSIYAKTDGRVEMRALKIRRQGLSSLSLNVAKVAAQVRREPVDAQLLPSWVRRRVPRPVQRALRHIRRLRVIRPVLVGSRQDAIQPSAVPASNPKTKSSLEKPISNKRKSRDGSIVRRALSTAFANAADRLEANLKRARAMMTALPFDEIVVEHGSARLRGEGSASAPKRDVSDYGLVLKRSDTEVSVDLDFAVSGSQSVQKIHGRLELGSGDMRLDIELARLPLAPYAAVLPSAINLHDTSVIENTNVSIGVDNKARSIVVEGQASISDIDLRAPKISRHVMTNLSLRTKGRLSLDLANNRLALSEGELQLGKMLLILDGSISKFRSAPDFDMQLKVPSISCQDLVASLVPDVAPMLDGMRCRGQLSFRLDFKLDTMDMKSMKLRYLPSLRRVEVTSLGRYIDLSVLEGPFEHHARQPDESLYTFVTGPGSERWAPLEGISDDMIKVVTTTEDGNFFKHSGFSLLQIRSAMVTNLLRGRFVRGASTISQQVVKNLFFVEREKTLARKLQEAVITWHLERNLTKQQILALYFNIIEFGPRVYGIRAASRHFFHREPLQLDLIQCLWLGSIIPNPRAFYHQFSEANMRTSWRRHLCVIADIMVKRTKITAAQRAALTDCTVPFGVAPEPKVDHEPGLGHEAAVDETLAPPQSVESASSVEAEDAP